MKKIAISLLPLLLSQMSHAAERNLDNIKSVECTVTEANVRSSFIPPEPGDKIILAIWATDVWDLKFHERPGTHIKPYIPLVRQNLERVDRAGFRDEGHRTWVGIYESFAALSRQEVTLELISEQTTDNIRVNYFEQGRQLPDGAWQLSDQLKMTCVPFELWP